MSESPALSPRHDACSKCGTAVDPLRAARVRLISNRFFYFCSQSCAAAFTEDDFRSSPPPAVPSAKYAAETAGLAREPTPRTQDTTLSDRPPRDRESSAAAPTQVTEEPARPSTKPKAASKTPQRDSVSPKRTTPTDTATSASVAPNAAPPSLGEQSATKPQSAAPSSQPPREARRDALTTPLGGGARTLWLSDESLLRVALGGGALSLTLLLATESLWVLLLRVLLTGLGAALLLLHSHRNAHSSEAPHPLEASGPTVLVSALALALILLQRDSAAHATTLASAVLLAALTAALVLARRERPVTARRRLIAEKLSQPPTRIRAGQLVQVPPERLRPGEEIIIHAGETVPADVTVTGGRAEVNPWIDAVIIRAVEPGESLYAGARLVSGQLRATVRWTGQDRHWERLLNDPVRRADVWAPLVLLGKRVSRQGTAAVVLLSVAAGLLLGTEASLLALQVLALASAFLSPALYRLTAIRTMQTVLDLQARGAVVKSAKVLDAAGRISTAVFCARGTLLLGEPELSYMESFSNLNHEQILALVVGAEQHGRHPVAVAVSRAARARNIRPDAVRTPLVLPGLGVTAVTSDGQQLVVGSRALMLKERISVARAEQRITAIEASGRTVLLIAIAQRLVGLVALQDGLRPGARAAVQHLLDAGIEPVLLSGDARRTCEALGKTIDIDHLRPEILPGERGSEIERLKSGGATVAVVGRSPADDIALSAASVAIALPSAGSRSTDFDIELASDEVQTAALALGLARHYRSQVLRGAAVIAALAVLSCLLVVGLSAPPAIVPALSIVAVLVAELFVFSARDPEKHAAH